MDRLHRAIKNVHRLDDLAARGTALTRLPPLPKLLAVLVYLCVTLSFQKYALTGLLGMALWPILLYEIDDLSIVKTLRQCWAVVALLVLVCAALRQLHVPRVLVTTILLTYRYIVLLLQEGNRISTAYALRAPGEKGIHFRAWGSLLGQLLLRSVDRAQLVYESMMLRGYGWHDDPAPTRQPQKDSAAGTVFFVATLMYCILFRVIPIFELLGQLF